MIRFSPVLAVGLCASIVVNSVSADEYEKNLRQILGAHWKSGLKHREAAKKIFQSTSSPTKAKSDFVKAYMINRVFHHRNSEAYEMAQILTRSSKTDLDAWYIKAWLELASGQVDRGLLTIQSLKKNMDAIDKLDGATRLKNLKRIGRLLGFSEIVSTAKPKITVNEATYEETVDAVLEDLKPADKQHINEQRKKVVAGFNEFRRRTKALKNEERLKLIEKRNQEINQIQNHSQLLEDQARKTEPKLVKLKLDFDKRRSELETRAAPLTSDLSRIGASISLMEQQLNLMYNDLLITETYAFRARDPFVRRRLFQQADIIALNIRDQEFALAGVYAQARGVSGQLSMVSGALNESRIAFQNESNFHRKTLNDIQKKLRRNAKKVTQLSKEPSVLTGKLVAINTRAGALKTYDPLPLESMRTAILNSLAK